MHESSAQYNSSKFTRGEKCIFAHVVITFAGIVAIVIIYFSHACLVHHRGNRALALGRISGGAPDVERPQYEPEPETTAGPESIYGCVGMAYVRMEGGSASASGERAACGTALLRASWSLAPARCVAARANPHLSHLLPHWTLRYDNHDTGVRRGAVHPNYDGEGALADIGLFEHERAIPLTELDDLVICAVPDVMLLEMKTSDSTDLFIVGWLKEGKRAAAAARVLSEERCVQLAEPVAPATASSLCLTPRPTSESRLPYPLLGSAVFEGSRLVGIASWGGDRGSGSDTNLPVLAVDVASYKYWLETTMKLL